MKDAGFGMSHDHFAESWEAAFQRQAQRFSAQQREFRMLDVARDFCSGLLPSPDERWPEKLAATFIDDWASQVTPVTPVTGAAGLVQRLSKHYRVGLISNTHYPPMVYSLLDTMSLSSVFEVVSLSVEVGVPKPDPGIFEQTLAKLRIEPADATTSVTITNTIFSAPGPLGWIVILSVSMLAYPWTASSEIFTI